MKLSSILPFGTSRIRKSVARHKHFHAASPVRASSIAHPSVEKATTKDEQLSFNEFLRAVKAYPQLVDFK